MELFPFSKVNFNENLLSSVTFIISRSLISKVSPVSQDFLIKIFWKPFEIFENFWKHFRHYDTAWKVSVFGVFLIHIFPHSGWIWIEFIDNAGIYGPETLQIRTLFTQCWPSSQPLMYVQFTSCTQKVISGKVTELLIKTIFWILWTFYNLFKRC